MKPRAGHIGHVGVMLAAICLFSIALTAQEQKRFVDAIGNVKPVPLPPGGPAPRAADGHVDLSGVWFSGKLGKTNAWSTEREEPIKEDPRPFQPWAAAKIKGMTRTEIQLTSPGVNCLPKGVPGVFLANPFPTQIIQLPGLFVQLIEAENNWRLVHTDGRPHQKNPDPLFYGDEVGHWEGDTLVIDTISIDERTWIMNDGWFHSDQLHVIERIRRPSMNYLEYQVTIEDPKVLTKPWTSAWRTFSLGHEDLVENYCTNNQNVEQLELLLRQQESDAKK